MKVLLCAGLLTAFSLTAPTLEFAPEAGSKVTKTFENGGLLELQSVEVTLVFDGEEHEMTGEEEGSIEISMSTVFTDEYGPLEEGRLTSLTRSFGEMTDRNVRSFLDEEGDEIEEEEEGESYLSGTAVAFEWDSEQEEYRLKFADDEERDEDTAAAMLKGLKIEADFTFLLPDEPVEVGDTWELPASAFDHIGNPGGDLKIWVDGEEDEDQDDFDEEFRENLEGALECTWSEVEEGQATILISGTISTRIDNEIETPEGAPDDLELSNRIEFEFEVEGKLVWDLEKNRASQFSLEGPLTMTSTLEQSGGDAQVTRVEVYEGTFYDRAKFE